MKKIFLLILLLVVGFSNVNGQTYTGMEFYDNGKPKSIKTYKMSKGRLVLANEIGWHENGQKEIEGKYKDGEKDGRWTSWWQHGQKPKKRLGVRFNLIFVLWPNFGCKMCQTLGTLYEIGYEHLP